MSDETTTAPAATPAPAPAPQQATTPAPAPPAEDRTGWVPQNRFSEVIKERNDALARAAEADAWKSKHDQLTKDLATARTSWEEEKSFLSSGITDAEAIDVARLFYGRLEAKPEGGIGAWLADLRADPTKAPKALAAYLPAVEAPASAESQAKPVARAVAPVAAPTGRPAPATGAVTVEALRAAREKAQQSKAPEDWAAHKTLSDIVKAELAKR